MTRTAAALVWSPCPDVNSAKALAHSLLDEHLIVCANIIPSVHSVFEWNGERGESAEVGLLVKTRLDQLEAVCHAIERLHPYDTPVAMGWKADAANAATLDWMAMMGGANEAGDG